MKYADIKDLPNAELSQRLREERRQLVKMNFAHGVGTLESPSKLKQSRKVIARILTEFNNRRTNQASKSE